MTLFFEGEGPVSWEFGRFADTEGEVFPPPDCVDNDLHAAIEMVGSVAIPFSGSYDKSGLRQPGEWIFASDNCEEFLLERWVYDLETMHEEDPPASQVESAELAQSSIIRAAFVIDDWDPSGKRVWDRTKTFGSRQITEKTTFEFVFPSFSN